MNYFIAKLQHLTKICNSHGHHDKVLLRQWLTREAGWRYGIMSTVPYKKLCKKIILLFHGRPVGIMHGIMSTVPYEQQELYAQIILLLHGRLVLNRQ